MCGNRGGCGRARLAGPARSAGLSRQRRAATERGLIERGRLTTYGRDVEAMPVERPWGELLYHAEPPLVALVAVASNIESLHRMTREERQLGGLIVPGSDHITAYNVYAEAVNKH